MSRHRFSAAVATASAALALVACSPPAAAPAPLRVTSVAVEEGRSMARQFCSDLGKLSRSEAISRMATRASVAGLSEADQDAIVDYAASITCPQLPR
jgi:hypothetical protein